MTAAGTIRPVGVNLLQETTGGGVTPSPFLPAAGSPSVSAGLGDLTYFPADGTGATTSTQVPDEVSGTNSATLLVFPHDQMVLGIKLAGDAHPRWMLTADSGDGLWVGDGTIDPFNGANIWYDSAVGLGLSAPDGVLINGGASGVHLDGGDLPNRPVVVLSQLGGNAGNASIFVYGGGNPNGFVNAVGGGDLCVLTDEFGHTPAIFQSTAAGTNNWLQVGFGGRKTATFTSTITLSGQQQQSTVALAKSYRLLHVTTTKACRVRLYTTAANQTADAGRAITEDPLEGSGVMLDYVTQETPVLFLGGDLAPLVDGASMEATPSANIPITLDLLENGPVVVTFTYVQTE